MSRLKTTSVCGWSNFTSVSANMKKPLVNAFITIWLASSLTRSGSAVEAITKSTGRPPPPPGREGGVSGMTRRPAISDSLADTSICSSALDFVRWLHGLRPMPAKPPLGKMIWKVESVSGYD